MTLTIQTLFNEPAIVSAVINRVLQTRKDRIYWQQYFTFRRKTQRVWKSYMGTYGGVMAGSINSQFGEKPIRERKNIGYAYTEVAYLGDRWQISVDRLSDLQDLIDKYNAARPADQNAALREIIDFVYDDFRQCMLAAHKRMDIIMGSLLMTGSASVRNRDYAVSHYAATELLNIEAPFNVVTPESADVYVDSKLKLVTYLANLLPQLAVDYGKYTKMLMSRATFNKFIVGSSEFGDTFKMQLNQNSLYMSTGLVTSELASEMFTGIGLPAIEIKEDYVKDQTGANVAIYADNRITLLQQDQIGGMCYHRPYEATDPVPGQQYTPTNDGDMLVSAVRDHNGRYLEYTAEWIPEIDNPQMITNINLSNIE